MNVETLLAALERRQSAQQELDSAALNVSRVLLDLEYQGTAPKQLATMLDVSHQRIYQLLARARRDVEGSIRAEVETAELERADAARAKRTAGRKSGLGGGRVQPRCTSCDQFVATVSSRCRSCGSWGGEY